MTEKVGYIPESVIYVCRKPTVFLTHWDGESWGSRLGQARAQTTLDLSTATTEQTTLFQKDVISAFPVSADPKNLESRMLTARQWASGVYYGRWNKSPVPEANKELTRENKPFTIQIIGLDIRSEGGRAYKVMDSEGHMFDLREDIAFETLMKEGCSPGGHLGCQFLWGVVRNNMKLIREGSLLHEALERASNRHNKEPIAVTNLKPGYLYQARSLDKKLFVGWIPAPRTKHKYKQVWLQGPHIESHSTLASALQGALGPDRYRYYLYAHIANEHKMVEQVSDFSDLLPSCVAFVTGDLQRKLAEQKVHLETAINQTYNREQVIKAREIAIGKLDKQLKEIESIQTTLETVDV